MRCFVQNVSYFNNPVFWDSCRLTYYPNVIFLPKEKVEKTSLTSIQDNFQAQSNIAKFTFAFVLNYIPSKEILGLPGLDSNFPRLQSFAFRDSDGVAYVKDGFCKDNKT